MGCMCAKVYTRLYGERRVIGIGSQIVVYFGLRFVFVNEIVLYAYNFVKCLLVHIYVDA